MCCLRRNFCRQFYSFNFFITHYWLTGSHHVVCMWIRKKKKLWCFLPSFFLLVFAMKLVFSFLFLGWDWHHLFSMETCAFNGLTLGCTYSYPTGTLFLQKKYIIPKKAGRPFQRRLRESWKNAQRGNDGQTLEMSTEENIYTCMHIQQKLIQIFAFCVLSKKKQ